MGRGGSWLDTGTHKDLFAALIDSMSEIYWDGNTNVRDYDMWAIYNIHEAIDKYWYDR